MQGMEGGPGQRFPPFKPPKPEILISKFNLKSGYKMWRIPCGAAARCFIREPEEKNYKGLTLKGLKDKGEKQKG